MNTYFSDPNLTIYNADVLAGLALLADKSVHCAITSPPYWGLRDYGIPPTAWPAVEFIPVAGLPPYTVPAMSAVFGLEPDPWSYVGHSVHVFRQMHRVLRDDGTLWLNLGDSYGGYFGDKYAHKPFGKDRTADASTPPNKPSNGAMAKQLLGIPWMVAKALQADGWYLRQAIIWAKKNCMPESVNDRPTASHEYIFLLSKSQRYYYDAEAVKEASGDWHNSDFHDGKNAEVHPSVGKNRPSRKSGNKERKLGSSDRTNDHLGSSVPWEGNTRNLRSVWHMATQPYPEAHFATFPSALPEICIKAGTSENGVCSACGAPWQRVVEKNSTWPDRKLKGEKMRAGSSNNTPNLQNMISPVVTTGWLPTCACNAPVIPAIVLDPFAGSGTTNATSENLGRRSIAIETKGEYCALILKRCHQQQII